MNNNENDLKKFETMLVFVKLILTIPRRLFFRVVDGEGIYVDSLNGQVLCPKCLRRGDVSHMMYDRHLEWPLKPNPPEVASDRFCCRLCNNYFSRNGRVGHILNKHNPFHVFTFANIIRCSRIRTRRWRRIHFTNKLKGE